MRAAIPAVLSALLLSSPSSLAASPSPTLPTLPPPPLSSLDRTGRGGGGGVETGSGRANVATLAFASRPSLTLTTTTTTRRTTTRRTTTTTYLEVNGSPRLGFCGSFSPRRTRAAVLVVVAAAMADSSSSSGRDDDDDNGDGNGRSSSSSPPSPGRGVNISGNNDVDGGAPLAGTFFFDPVPNPTAGSDDDDENDNDDDAAHDEDQAVDEFDRSMAELMRRRKAKPRASTPSTIGGIPTSQATGFGKPKTTAPRIINTTKPSTSSSSSSSFSTTGKSFIGIGKPLNDINNPEYDDQGYTLYADEETGKKSRVFEALVQYPCKFTMKIVGKNEGGFVGDVVRVVAECCNVEFTDVEHNVRVNGKWTSVTVQAPVESAEMLYALYEKIDLDPRVKFKF